VRKVWLFVAVLACFLVCSGCGEVQESGEYPMVRITQPGKTHYFKGGKIKFDGYGKDRWVNPSGKWEECTLMDSQLVWTSDIDGQIGTGSEEFEINNLSAGDHIITLTGTGYNEVKVSASIILTVEQEEN
jgi:hypothetical protein